MRLVFASMTRISLVCCEAPMSANTSKNSDRLLRRAEAAKYVVETYNVLWSHKTLAKLACVRSDGPPFRLAGRTPLYPISGLDAWAQKKSDLLSGQPLKFDALLSPPFRDTKPGGTIPWRDRRAR